MRPDRRVGLLLAMSVTCLFAAILVAVVLPAGDRSLGATSVRRTFDARALRGMDVFRSEGCWYCHTQQVRPLRTDAGLGAPLSPGDYRDNRPAMLGAERGGPDLTHVGSRYSDKSAVLKLLARGRRSMPSYAHLSPDDLDALAQYLLALK